MTCNFFQVIWSSNFSRDFSWHLTFYWCVLQREIQESRKGTDQVGSDDVEIQQPQCKEQTGIHFMSECFQNSGERFNSLVLPVLFWLMNIFFLPLEPCQSQLSLETQSQNNSVQSEGQPSKSSEYHVIISKHYLSWCAGF